MVTSANTTPPAGWSMARFNAISAEAGGWLWGTVQGAFNEKATLSQIVVDAVVGMIPFVGDATAVRDLIAVLIGLIDSPSKRAKVWEWVLLVVLLFALIPVLGGVIKGVGRLAIKAAKESAPLTGVARAAKLTEAAQEIMAFLNRIGSKNAEKWFLTLRVGEYQAQLLERFGALLNTFSGVLQAFSNKLGKLMPPSLGARIGVLQAGLQTLKAQGQKMIPQAVKELDQMLREIQAYVRAGGETTSRMAAHQAATGERVVTRAEEARLIEGGALPARSMKGGWKQNIAKVKEPGTYENLYKHEPAFPNLKGFPEDGHYKAIEAFSGRMVNRELKEGEQIVRFFGPGGTTYRVDVDPTKAGGGWWWLGAPPKTAKEWRELAAVLDEFNRDGFMVVATITGKHPPKAVVGTVAEQYAEKIPGQYLPGGGTQAFFFLERASSEALTKVGQEVMASKKAAKFVDPVSGISYEVKPTGWTDANEIHGYLNMPGPAAVHTSSLGASEMAIKENREVSQ